MKLRTTKKRNGSQPKDATIRGRVTIEFKSRVEAHAALLDTSEGQIVRDAVKEYLARHQARA